jgi:hypothetical protein
VARVFFKSSELTLAWDYLRGLVGLGEGRGVGLELGVVAVTVATIALNFWGARWFETAVRIHERVPLVLRPAAWTAAALALLAARPYDVAFTIYFGF